MAGLLEQAGSARLGLLDLLRGLLLRLLQRLARLGLGRVDHLGPLALALVAVALDLALPLLKLALAPADLLFGPAQLRGRSGLGIPLDRVGHLGSRADHVQGVHADRMPGRLDAALPGRLEHAQLNLKLGRVAAECLEGLANLFALVAVALARQILDARQRRQRRRLGRSSLAFSCHPLLSPGRPAGHAKYDCCIGS